jgi:tetratricopeptide (TPR) repeat protein
VKRISFNLLYFSAFLLIAIMIAGQGCASKKMARQAQKLEEAGLYEMAAENYLRSFNSNRKNVEAASGLRRTGQRTLDLKAGTVTQAYLSGDDRETVYKYLETQAYHQRIRNTGIELSMPGQINSYYEIAKQRFLDSSFEEARLLLEEENFSQAGSIFSEIQRIDPAYQDLSQYMRISTSEPLYRQGVDQLNSGFYRRAYNTFTNLMIDHGTYKDARELREDALSRGMITIAIADFDNGSRTRNAHILLKSRIIAEISSVDNPFVRIVDDRNKDAFLKEQELASQLGGEMQIGKLMAARALLTGTLLSFEIQEGRMQRTERKAYLKEVTSTEDPITKEKSTRTDYHKVTYQEFRQENKACGSFQFQLSSTETGAVLASGVFELSPHDQVWYSVFEGNAKNLVPGHWESKTRDSAKDIIQDEPNMVRNLQNQFSARKTIKSPDMLRSELINGIATSVSRAVNAYNPEK